SGSPSRARSVSPARSPASARHRRRACGRRPCHAATTRRARDSSRAPPGGSPSNGTRRPRWPRAPSRAACARAPPPARRSRSPAVGLELLFRTEAVVRLIVLQQLFRVRIVEVQPLRLLVRTARTADVRPLVPVETQPAQIAQDCRLGLRRRTLHVGILDTQHEG